MADVSFVRKDFIDQQEPPARERGAIKWARENLFNGWLNSILTILSIYFIIRIVIGVWPWFANGVWTTSALAECRQVFEGATAACFSVLMQRGNQMLFGISYPAEDYWRPTLAFVLLFVAAAPVLFSKLPRAMLVFSALYPFLAYWLIWGGAFWVPLLVIAGLLLTYLAFKTALNYTSDSNAILSGFAVFLVWFVFIIGALSSGIDRSVGALRMDAKTLEVTERIEALVAEIASIEDQIAAQSDTVDDLLTGADAAVGEEARAIFAAAFADREVLRLLVRDKGALEGDLSANRSLLRRIEALPDLEAELPDLRARAEELRAALPDTVSSVTSAAGQDALSEQNAELDLNIPREDLAALEEALEAESDAESAERNIARTFNDVARIGFEPVPSRDMGGFMLNMILGTICVSLSLPIGILLALGRQSNMPIVKGICVVFIEFVRGVPL
ncbi:MAG: hypothetical protein AAGF13_03830, partial [Pseudomonadota bacterium]